VTLLTNLQRQRHTKLTLKNAVRLLRQLIERYVLPSMGQICFVLISGAVLLWLGITNLTTVLVNAGLYDLSDPAIGIKIRYTVLIIGVLETLVGVVCLLNATSYFSIVLLSWLTMCLVGYRVSLAILEWPRPYHWISPVMAHWDVSSNVADLIVTGLLAWIWVGGITFLVFGKAGRVKEQVVVFYKTRCQNCGGKVEFPAHGLGRQVPCPHCSAPMILVTTVENQSSEKAPSNQSAFTLVELLVVIAIIGILASLLMPVLNKAKDRASRVVDINNLKQLITATHLYAADASGILPWPNWALGDSPDRPGWLYRLDPQAQGPARFKVETGVFWPMLRNSKLYFCPRDGPHTPRFNERPQQISSYVMNGAVIGYNRTNYPPARLEAFRYDDVAFWETDEKYPDYFNDGASYPSEGVSARHALGAIHATFGGAVEYIKLEVWYLEEAKPTRNRLWCYPGSKDGR